jgi:hypothetical protein
MMAFALARRNRDENSPRLRSRWWSVYASVTSLGWVDRGDLDCDHLAVVDLVPGPGRRLAGKSHRALRGEGLVATNVNTIVSPARRERNFSSSCPAARYQVAVDDRGFVGPAAEGAQVADEAIAPRTERPRVGSRHAVGGNVRCAKGARDRVAPGLVGERPHGRRRQIPQPERTVLDVAAPR